MAVLTAEPAVEAMKAAAYRGLTSKINVWLARTSPAGFIVLDVPARDVEADRPRALPRAVMAAEDLVLFLTENGFGSCWLGGVNSREIARAAGLTAASSVPAVISFGTPVARRRPVSYGAVTERTMSRRRKPMSRIARLEEFRVPYEPALPSGPVFTASEAGVLETVEVLAGERGPLCERPAPLETALEVCLEAGRVAPSGGNAQAWTFVVVAEPRRLEVLSGSCGERAEAIGGGRAAIVAMSSMRKLETVMLDKPFWMLDVPIAMSHMALAAVSMGYGPAVALDGIDETEVGRLLKAPASMRTVGVIGLV